MPPFKNHSKLFEDKVERVIKKYLDPRLKYAKTPNLPFGKPDFVILHKNIILVILDATKTKKKRLITHTSGKVKQMLRYADHYVSILVRNSNVPYCIEYFSEKRKIGDPTYFVMSVSILKKYLIFLSKRMKSTLQYYGFVAIKVNQHSIVDDFIDTITDPKLKCKFCKNRLINVDLYHCPDLKEYAIELYMDEEQPKDNNPYEMTFSEFSNCEAFGKCKHFRSILGKQCRNCGAVFDNAKLIALKDFNSYHADNLEEDFEFYKKKTNN